MRDPPSRPLLPQGRKRELATPQSLIAPYNRRCRGPRLFWNFLAASDAFSASCEDRERTCGEPCQDRQTAEIALALFACLPGQNYRNGAIASLRSRKSAFELPFANKVAGNTDCRRDNACGEHGAVPHKEGGPGDAGSALSADELRGRRRVRQTIRVTISASVGVSADPGKIDSERVLLLPQLAR